MGTVILSERLKALCHMVTPGKNVVDVGCDHGFVSIYLVQQGICPGALAMDVRTGPLSRAKEHIAEQGLEDYIETRLSDGLLQYESGEAASMVCAGMGGRLMEKILTESREKAHGLAELILQPQSELKEFREFLIKDGYQFLDEDILCEDGKYYFLMKVCQSGRLETAAFCNDARPSQAFDGQGFDMELALRYGPLLLVQRHPVLREFLEESLQNMEQIERQLAQNETERARKRLDEIWEEIRYLKQALEVYRV